ncbi:hypothetical protein EDB80DRAFT_706411 [Ilyonectria destructans]|nr:hypothetical protein EDB80DRAFT_706411 [Ilyonectria destructans]
MTTERIEVFERVAFAAPAQAVPPETTKTQEKIREILEKSELAQRFKNQLPIGRVGFPDDLASYVSDTPLLVDGAQMLS